MPKLNQIIAIEKGVKTKAFQQITETHQQLLKPSLLSGISRNYQPRDEEGEQLPPESTLVQLKAQEVIKKLSQTLTELFDITATKDWTNCKSKANVVVDGEVLLSDVPSTYLLFLEKQLVDIHTFIKKLPMLDPAETWRHDPGSDVFVTEPVETVRTKKVPRNHVKAEATEKHPAQVEVYYEDIQVGKWRTLKYSGALPASRINELLERVEKLQKAVQFAREEANSVQAEEQKIGDKLFKYLFQ